MKCGKVTFTDMYETSNRKVNSPNRKMEKNAQNRLLFHLETLLYAYIVHVMSLSYKPFKLSVNILFTLHFF